MGRNRVVLGCLLAAGFGMAAMAGEVASATRTFRVQHLDLDEASRLIRETLKLQNVSVDVQARTVVVEGQSDAAEEADVLLRVFDTADSDEEGRLEIRVFPLTYVDTREVVMLLRRDLQMQLVEENRRARTVAVRDTAARVQAATALIHGLDVAGR
ncbi:MAG TPA: secretin N-terminal domain-containing protein [Candidatus Polarisedimenticolaceae bacterium]|nr:secretin N-terminal domain-containing protein [Candidatus Polarisedimenticolaceae bacterium]